MADDQTLTEVPSRPKQKIDLSAGIVKKNGNPKKTTSLTVYGSPKGLVAPGNIDLSNRPIIQNEGGSHSSEYSFSFGTDKGEVLVPTVVNGKFLTPDGKKPPEGSDAEKAMFKAAREHYEKTGEHMGIFASAEDADAYANQVHNRPQQTSSGSLDLSSGIVPRKKKSALNPDKPSPGTVGSLWHKATTTLAPESLGRMRTETAETRKRGQELIASGHPVAGYYQKYLADTWGAIDDVVESASSPLGLGLAALSSGESLFSRSLLPKVIAKPVQIATGAGFAATGVAAAGQPKRPDEDWYAYTLRQGSAAIQVAAGSWGSVTAFKDVLRGGLRKAFGLSDDLATKAADNVTKLNQERDVARIREDNLRRTQAEGTAEIQAQKARLAPVQKALQQGTRQIDPGATRIERQISDQIGQLEANIPKIEDQKIAAGTQIVADTVRTLDFEQSRLSAMFDDIGKSVKDPVATESDIHGIIDEEASKAGIQPKEIPSGARAALGKQVEGESLSDQIGPPPKTARPGFGLQGVPATEGAEVDFDRATRIKDDLYEQAAKAKDGVVRKALYNAADRVSDLQEEAAKKAGQGKKYAQAKSEYKNFRRGIGSREVNRWLAAEDVKQQQIPAKLAALAMTGDRAQRSAQFGLLRTVLREYNISTKPFDDLLKQSNQALSERKVLLGEEKAAAKARGTAAVSEAEAAGKEIVPGMSTSELAGLSTEQMNRLRLESVSKSSGYRRGLLIYRMSMAGLGLYRLASGQAWGMFEVGLGATALIPEAVKNKSFQDFLIRDAGAEPMSPEGNRLRRVISSWYPFLRKAAQSGLPATAASGPAEDQGKLSEIPSR